MARRQITDRDILAAKEKYKELNRKQKMSYIWEYYKIQIVVGIFLFVMFGSYIYTTLINPAPKNGFSVTFIDTTADERELENKKEDISKALLENYDKYGVQFNVYYVNAMDLQMNSITLQKIMAQLTIQEFDIFIMTDEVFESYAELDIFQDLTTAVNFPINEYELAYYKSESDETEKPYGIYLPACKFLEEINIVADNHYIMSIIVNGLHTEITPEFLDYIYNY